MKTIVISAVNLRKGGTLAILKDCLKGLSEIANEDDVRVVALVHQKDLVKYKEIEYIEIPWAARSWAHRLWCEYVTMNTISKHIGDIDIWLSLHDTTPRVQARHHAVYCHNSYPFYSWKCRHIWQNYRIVCFAIFSRWFYRINLYRNQFVIVQSQWFRKAFNQMTGFDVKRTIVFPPVMNNDENSFNIQNTTSKVHKSKFTFLYPAFPDVHKNMECLCRATEILEREMRPESFEVLITTDSNLNQYSRWLHKKWGHVRAINFCGFVCKERLDQIYANTDCLVFPSQVETWGLPITEFAVTGRPMILADRPYAHETAAGSCCTAFFDPDDPVMLAQLMRNIIEGRKEFFQPIAKLEIESPLVNNWEQLISKLSTSSNVI